MGNVYDLYVCTKPESVLALSMALAQSNSGAPVIISINKKTAHNEEPIVVSGLYAWSVHRGKEEVEVCLSMGVGLPQTNWPSLNLMFGIYEDPPDGCECSGYVNATGKRGSVTIEIGGLEKLVG